MGIWERYRDRTKKKRLKSWCRFQSLWIELVFNIALLSNELSVAILCLKNVNTLL